MKFLKKILKILKIIFYLISTILILLVTAPYLLDKSTCLFAEKRLLSRLKEANETKNIFLLQGIVFDSRICRQEEIYDQASVLICADFNYNDFIKELNEANKTKNRDRLLELDVQSKFCIKNMDIRDKIWEEFELYKLYWRE
ncbi:MULTISPECIES: hypothetical protein [unclassified Campylobacter]|uniref:hypothetical protein n=1 Tax=unclassified Campylobacter TaxID=2593542 RepID=UPI0022E9CB98|nr:MULTISPECIES: hypothetical protein [unclassified Campylobacter]MDA3042787.1 hypothetical protein [Campylobacter sp. JMF_09 ED2]MDA3044378.1 hypothetical protein [Campylobacter sp. JMF_07 ED4]MDA3063724.1 hypothetical protein [Campylobacter sp. JMF_11 EL3]MDA3071353.1 hypothetical protein [Campylobacter sp. VBCF_03 NA9]MDA3074813.1 hypothetical protein [Campylobacter sp. JMF_05 ED3]